jgi:uncharacterized membrane protein YhaH (DUF805 family)
MGFKSSIISALYQYATFTGRASRSEFWYFLLFCFLCGFAAGIMDLVFFGEETVSEAGTFYNAPQRFSWIPMIIFLLPNLALTIRRLHDLNMSGWWTLTSYVPIALSYLFNVGLLSLIGFIFNIILLILFCRKGTDGDNRYGYSPLTYS